MRGTEIIAHRGASREAPENTLAAFRLAFAQGADGIEGDFRLTRDGEIVCLHDATTGRTAGADLVVADADLARLRALDVGAWKGPQWAGERIPTLAEVLGLVPAGKRLYIELKSGPEILPRLRRVLAAAGLDPGQVVLLSFSQALIAAAREFFPGHTRLWITAFRRNWRSGALSPDLATVLHTLAETGASGLASQAHRVIDRGFVEALHAAGRELHVWPVDDLPAARRLALLGVEALITNRPGRLRAGGLGEGMNV